MNRLEQLLDLQKISRGRREKVLSELSEIDKSLIKIERAIEQEFGYAKPIKKMFLPTGWKVSP